MARYLRWLSLASLVALIVIAGCGKKDVVSKPDGSTSTSTSTTEPGTTGDSVTDAGETGSTTQEPGAGDVTKDTPPKPPTAASDQGAASTDTKVSNPTPGPGEVLLRLNVKKGQKFAYTVTQNMNAMGGTSTLTLDTVMTVLDVTGDKARIEFKVLDAKVSGGEASARQMMEQQAKALKNTSYTADYDPLGRMTNIESKGASNPFEAFAGKTMMGMQFPETPVKVGSSWTSDVPIPVPGQESKPIKVNYTLTKASGNDLTIATKINHSLTMQGPPAQQGQQAQSAKMSMKADGSTVIEKSTGMLKTLNMAITISIEVPQMGTQNQKMTITMKRK
ncbi:MAG: hypothetical protein KatS3mg015_1002 [Fimbriimonadales bacterium]|nr:MAG: hypothetical protein KatS3mg015_1002 [Fimbriimonadales bacterium]